MAIKQFECHKCGHTWLQGHSGSHDCSVLLLKRIQELESAIRECYQKFEDYDMGCDNYAPKSHKDFMLKLSAILQPERNGCWTPYREKCDCPACGGFND